MSTVRLVPFPMIPAAHAEATKLSTEKAGPDKAEKLKTGGGKEAQGGGVRAEEAREEICTVSREQGARGV